MKSDAEFAEMIEKCPELVLFIVVDGMGGMIWRLEHDMHSGRIPCKEHDSVNADVRMLRRRQKLAVLQTARFGLEAFDKDNHPTKDYWKWYRWWNEWKSKTLTDSGWKEVDAAIDRGLTEEEIKKYRPEGSWREHSGKYSP